MTAFEIIVIVLLVVIAILLAVIYGESVYRTNDNNQKSDLCIDNLISILGSLGDISQQLDDIEYNVHDDLYTIISKLNKPKAGDVVEVNMDRLNEIAKS